MQSKPIPALLNMAVDCRPPNQHEKQAPCCCKSAAPLSSDGLHKGRGLFHFSGGFPGMMCEPLWSFTLPGSYLASLQIAGWRIPFDRVVLLEAVGLLLPKGVLRSCTDFIQTSHWEG